MADNSIFAALNDPQILDIINRYVSGPVADRQMYAPSTGSVNAYQMAAGRTPGSESVTPAVDAINKYPLIQQK